MFTIAQLTLREGCPLEITRDVPQEKNSMMPSMQAFVEQAGRILVSFSFVRVYGPRLRLSLQTLHLSQIHPPYP